MARFHFQSRIPFCVTSAFISGNCKVKLELVGTEDGDSDGENTSHQYLLLVCFQKQAYPIKLDYL